MPLAKVWNPHDPGLWPGESQRLLLCALLLREDEARESWDEWSRSRDLRDVSVEDSALLPPLYLAADRLRINQSLRPALREAYRAAWLKNEFAIGHLRRLLHAMNAARLPVLVLKGVPLLLFYYRDAGARRMADVDVLVRESDLPRVARLLGSLQWGTETGLPPPQVSPYHHAMHWHHASGFHLDLHWRAWTPDASPSAEEDLWLRCVTRTDQGIEMRIPCPEDLLILMCYHGRKQDRLARGRWVLDVAKILEVCGPEIDLHDLRRRVEQCGLAAPVGDSLNYICREYGVATPPFASHSPARDDTGARMRYRELARHALAERGLGETLVSGWWRYAAVQRARGRTPRWASFVAFYLEDRRWQWGLDRRRQVPGRALRKALSRLRTQGL